MLTKMLCGTKKSKGEGAGSEGCVLQGHRKVISDMEAFELGWDGARAWPGAGEGWHRCPEQGHL